MPLPLPTLFFEFWFAQLCVTDSTQRFLGATSSSNNTAGLAGFAEALRWAESFISHGERVRILYFSKHVARVDLGDAHARRKIALANVCNVLVLRFKDRLGITGHHLSSRWDVEIHTLYSSTSTSQLFSACTLLHNCSFCLQSLCTLDRSPNALTLAQETP